jgi:hypothetical protein
VRLQNGVMLPCRQSKKENTSPPKKARKVEDTPVNGDITSDSDSSLKKDFSDEPLTDRFCDPANPKKIQFQDVSAAAYKIKSGVQRTPCTVCL